MQPTHKHTIRKKTNKRDASTGRIKEKRQNNKKKRYLSDALSLFLNNNNR
jgi:hypothetical protein